MLTKDTFKRLVISIANRGRSESKEIDGIRYRAYRVSEITLILASFKDKWTPEGITFTLFDSDFFLSPDGSVVITDTDDPESDMFELTDKELLAVVASFLKWRLNVVVKLKV